MRKRWIGVLTAVLVSVLFFGAALWVGVFFLPRAASTSPDQAAAASSGRPQGRLILTGSSTVAPLAAEIGKRFEAMYPEMRVDVQSGGSSRGIADTREGLAHIGMVSRALKTQEEDLFAFPIARDGISIIVHRSNPITRLSDAQIAEIYTGKITNWREVGGQNGPIVVVNKAEGRSTLEIFLGYFHLKNSQIRPHVIIGDNEQGIKVVAGNPNAVGYVSIGTAEYDISHGISIKLLPIGGVEATAENIQTGSFPLSRPLNLITRTKPQGLAKRFIDFASSEEVHDIVREQSFIPITPITN